VLKISSGSKILWRECDGLGHNFFLYPAGIIQVIGRRPDHKKEYFNNTMGTQPRCNDASTSHDSITYYGQQRFTRRADDTNHVLGRNDRMDHVQDILNEWCQMSGAKFNHRENGNRTNWVGGRGPPTQSSDDTQNKPRLPWAERLHPWSDVQYFKPSVTSTVVSKGHVIASSS